MADYFSVIKRTIDTLEPNTREARRALYERARTALLDRLQAAEPRLPMSVFEAEQASLEAAIERVEAQHSQRRPAGASRRMEVPPVIARVLTGGPADERVAPAGPRERAPEPPRERPQPPDAYRDRPQPPDDRRDRIPPPQREPARPGSREQAPRFDEPMDEMAEPPSDESAARRVLASPSRGVLIGVAAAVLLVAAGLATYFLWPSKTARPVATPARAPATTTTTTTPPPTRQRSAATQVVNYVYLRQPVYYRTTHPVGTMIVDKSQNFLYVVRPNVVAIRYGIGTGAECNSAAGLYKVTRKEEYPGLKASASADDRANNPLGARALYLDTAYRMHGTNSPQMIGRFAPLGCIRLSNEDIIELYNNTPLDTRVVVTD